MTPTSARSQGSPWTDFVAAQAQVLSIAVFFLACFVIFSVTSDAFLTPGNLLNMLRQSAPMLIVAVAMTFVITTGGIDLSVGSTVALVNALAAILMQFGIPWPIVVAMLLLIGAAVGAAQGWFVAYEGLPAFIVTLAGLSVLRGVALLMTQGFSIPIATEGWFVDIGRGWLLGVPFPAVLAILAAIFGFVALDAMRFGRHVIAIGANLEARNRPDP